MYTSSCAVRWCKAIAVSAGIVLSAGVASASVGGFSDTHETGGLRGWTPVGGRRWVEKDGVLTTLSPDSTQVSGGSHTGFLLSDYPSSDDGVFETTLTLDPWNGQAGGVVLRWSSPSSYYFIAVQPGNQWSSRLIFNVDSMDESTGTVVARNFSVGTTVLLRVVAQGATFQIYLDDELMATVTDTAHAYGRVGFSYTSQWNNYLSALETTWTDADGSQVSQQVDPRAGVVALKVHVMDEAFGEGNIIKPRLYIENTGEVTVSNFDAFYLFTVESGKTPILEDYYTPESSPSLISLGDDLWAVEYHFSGFDLPPGATTPDPNGNVVGIHYADWSAMDKSDDFSAPVVQGMQESQTIPVQGLFRSTADYSTSTSSYILAGGELPTETYTVKHLELTRLRCLDVTADDDATFGWDSVAVVVKTDGQVLKTIDAGDMDEYGDQSDDDPKNYYFDGNGGTDNDGLEFLSTVNVSLYDYEDNSFSAFSVRLIDWDTTDFMGSHDLDTSLGSHTKIFDRDGEYNLYYTISEVEVEKSYTSIVDFQLDRFRSSTAAGVWADVDKTTLLDQIATRLAEPAVQNTATVDDVTTTTWKAGPGVVDQGSQNYCGPAAILYTMIKNRPLRYVAFMRNLFEDGIYYGKYHDYEASDALLGCLVPTNRGMEEADWIAMSTISDSAIRWAFHFKGINRNGEIITEGPDGYPTTSDFGKLLGETRNDDMGIWAKDILGYPYVDDDSSLFWGEESIIEKASDYASGGGLAAIAVANDHFRDGLDPTIGEEFLTIPNHYVVFVGDLDISNGSWISWDSGSVSFRYWNYGADVQKELSEEAFEDSVSGATFAE